MVITCIQPNTCMMSKFGWKLYLNATARHSMHTSCCNCSQFLPCSCSDCIFIMQDDAVAMLTYLTRRQGASGCMSVNGSVGAMLGGQCTLWKLCMRALRFGRYCWFCTQHASVKCSKTACSIDVSQLQGHANILKHIIPIQHELMACATAFRQAALSSVH